MSFDFCCLNIVVWEYKWKLHEFTTFGQGIAVMRIINITVLIDGRRGACFRIFAPVCALIYSYFVFSASISLTVCLPLFLILFFEVVLCWLSRCSQAIGMEIAGGRQGVHANMDLCRRRVDSQGLRVQVWVFSRTNDPILS